MLLFCYVIGSPLDEDDDPATLSDSTGRISTKS